MLEEPAAVQGAMPALYATEAAMASCPACSITYVEAATSSPNDVGAATAFAVRSLKARLIVVTINASEPRDTDPVLQRNFYDVRGLTLFVPAGDNGSDNRVGMPGTSPTALAVGGTTVTRTTNGWISGSWGGTSATCDRTQPRPDWQRGVTDCSGRAVNDISAAANPDVNPLGVVVSNGAVSFTTTAGGTAVAAGILAGWTARSGLSGILTPSWLYRHRALLQDVTSGPSNHCVNVAGYCTDRPDIPTDDCTPDLASPRTCVPAAGWDGLTGLGTPGTQSGLGATRPPSATIQALAR